ncbi:MAG: YgiQ family radical SAM protein [Firmicutes bacterium]|nr:YgiQ family radical SAM protein [Bacillota bacterium]
MFLPTTREEMDRLGWDGLDVILISGDTYIDSPYIGAAVIGKVLQNAGYRVGIIAQPDTETEADITRLGEPYLFWGVTSGSVDSMVANYTASKKRRRQDDFTPGGINSQRPDRALIVYTNLIRRYFKTTKPIVLGGIEASLRRIAHYDYWTDTIRRSILFDTKADLIVYGMGEATILELTRKLAAGIQFQSLRGICYIAAVPPADYLQLPSFTEVKTVPEQLIKMFHLFYGNSDPATAKGLVQLYDGRYLIQNPPSKYLSEKELSAVHDLDYERDVHPYYKKNGEVRALDTIRFSINTHRGCYGECNFCSIAVHQGRTVRSRNEESILAEARTLTKLPDFKGYILDLGGPTANMYGIECQNKLTKGGCASKRCLHPNVCKNLKVSHVRQIELLKKIRKIPGIKKVFVASGIRYDLILNDRQFGIPYLEEIIRCHVSGQMKIAPEHTEDQVLKLMGKPGRSQLLNFIDLYNKLNQKAGKKQFLTYYFIAAHPGCDREDMIKLKQFAAKELKLRPEQVQIFTPLPSTYSALMYYTGINPFTGEQLFVEKNLRRKEEQKMLIVAENKSAQNRLQSRQAQKKAHKGRPLKKFGK